MRILVVGAGAIGGYFGGRLLQAGRDVTFLVRPKRAMELARDGLVIKSPNGDVTLKNPPTVQADKLTEKFDVVLLSCTAFDLNDAIKSFAAAVGPQSAIIPLLNGMRHIDVLDDSFGRTASLAAGAASPPRWTSTVTSFSSRPFSNRSTSASLMARCRIASAPSPRILPPAISVRRRARTSCRRCGRSGCCSRPLPVRHRSCAQRWAISWPRRAGVISCWAFVTNALPLQRLRVMPRARHF